MKTIYKPIFLAAFCVLTTSAQPSMIDLGTLGGTLSELPLPGGTINPSAVAINNRGQVIGLSHTSVPAQTHAFLWTAKDGMIDLGCVAKWPFSVRVCLFFVPYASWPETERGTFGTGEQCCVWGRLTPGFRLGL